MIVQNLVRGGIEDLDEKVQYWLNTAEEDLAVAKYLLAGAKLLYTGFMCHQAVEKALKAVIARDCADDEIPPKIHDLLKLAVRAKLFDVMSEEQRDFIDGLNPLNIEARYPEYKAEMTQSLTKEKCQGLVIRTEDLLCWIKAQL